MAFLVPDNLKSRRDVPGPIQRVAKALEMGLDDRATVWFEPPFDPSRQKPHFVLLLPDRGVVVMEVFEAKAGGILGTVRGKVRLTRDGQEVEVDSPLARAERFAATLRERVRAEPRLSGLEVTVGAGAVLASLTQEEAQAARLERVLDLTKCLCRPELDAALAGTGEAAVLRKPVAMVAGTHRDPLPEEAEKVLRGLIQPEVVIGRVTATAGEQLTIFRPPEGDEDVVRVMDRQQEAMAKSLGDGHRVIRGVAGSGKTLILVYRAQLLARALPQHRFLLACYNRSLAGELRALLDEYPNIEVCNIDRLMSREIYAAGLVHPGYVNDPTGEEVAKAALEALQAGQGERYRAVLIDEGQDFSTSYLRFALGLLQEGADDFVIVADSAQRIYRRACSWKSAGIQAQGRTRILRVNYRNTREILAFASAFLLAGGDVETDVNPDAENEDAVIPPDTAKRSGPQPVLRVCGDSAEETRAVVQQVESWVARAAGSRSIGVLYGTSGDGGAAAVYDALCAAGIDVFWVTDSADRTARDRLCSAESPVVLCTVQSAKGVEFPKVVLCLLWKDDLEPAENRKLTYVGMTRASNELTVVTTRSNPLVDDLQNAARA
ncbi:MAG: 3'-5' exonuclease [Candidatus Latescibacterota bacterium]